MGARNNKDVITAHVKSVVPADKVSSFKDCAVWVMDVKLYLSQEQYEELATKGTQLSLVVYKEEKV
jgi:hypothetical protein